MAVSYSVPTTTIHLERELERDLSGPDSAALDRAKVRTMSKTSHADSYR